MHKGELAIDEHLVSRLLARQFPQFSTLSLRKFESSGTVHVIYVLGHDISVRLPRLPEFEAGVLREWKWLSYLSSRLPLQIPEPMALGGPAAGYPCHWMVVRWIEGETATELTLRSLDSAAEALGRFVFSLRETATNGEHVPQYRGRPLRARDRLTREAVSQVTDEYPEGALIRAWETALRIDDWKREPRLFHGDLHSGNLISTRGELSAVIDFGSLGTGDPSVDGIPAWWLFTRESRSIFREAAKFDADLWERAKGWALSIALIALPYYRKTNPVFADMARRAIEEVLADR